MLTPTFRLSPMQPRGRSRHVSPVALARQASEERRRSLPPPPQSLQDQIHVAYAHDNIRLAKQLLLKLKGIHVKNDNDPRIDQVRDEDFDICFAPSRPLTLDDADNRAPQETQHKHKYWWHETQRAQRLRACEKLWDDEKNRLHVEKQRAIQRREREQERARLAEMAIQQQRAARAPPRTVAATRRSEDPFQYAFMLPPKPSSPVMSTRSHKQASLRSPGRPLRSVSFKEVVSAMNGPLFPLDASERADDARRIAGLPISSSTSHRHKTSVRADLLDTLLHVAESQQGERRITKGKGVARLQQATKPQLHLSPTPTPSVPSSLSVTSLSSSASPSRSSSWLNFGSWRSTATDITTPDSPMSASPASFQSCLPTLIEAQHDFHPRCAFVRISVEESPLCPNTLHPISSEDDNACVTRSDSTAETLGIRQVLVKRVSRSVTTVIEAAKCLQSVYITATMFTTGFPYVDTVSPSPPHESMRCQWQARREGYRALSRDVQTFTVHPSPISQQSEAVHFIPLTSRPSSAKSGLAKPPGPRNALIFPSPLKPREPPNALVFRTRPVGNPAVLRLKALQNIMDARGKEWEGRAREGGIGCGKERLVGFAFEGRGRSGLVCDVRFVVA